MGVHRGTSMKTSRPHWRAPTDVQVHARALRANLTMPERRLWRYLRAGQLAGAQFRRQHAVGRFVVDFFCAKAKLVVEIDGDSHATQRGYDHYRTNWLEGKGYTVLRFTNREVMNQLDAVVGEIAQALKKPPP